MMMHDKCKYEKMLMKLTDSNCMYGHTDKHVAGTQSKSAKPAPLRASPASPGKLSGTAGRSCHPRACPALNPFALKFTLCLPAQGPTSPPNVSSKSDKMSPFPSSFVLTTPCEVGILKK